MIVRHGPPSGAMRRWVALLVFSSLAASSASPAVSAQISQPDIIQEHWYHSYATLTLDVNAWEDEYPEIVKLLVVGQTEMGRNLWMLQISDWSQENRPDGAAKEVVYIDGGHHGNEHLGTELAFLVAEHYIEGWADGDQTVLDVLATTELHILIMLNADGNDFDTRWNINQVDLNRNYDHYWNTCPTTQPGSAAFSESETLANSEYMNEVVPHADLYITMHTGVWIMLYPWGKWPEQPSDWEMYHSIRDEVNSNISEIPIRNANQGLYPNCGTSRDYGYGVMGFPTFTFETDDEQFLLGSVEAISDRLGEELDVMEYLIENVWYWRARLHVSSLDVGPGDSVTLSVDNLGHASTQNASLHYETSEGEVLWHSDVRFAVNASNSTTVTFDASNLTLADGGGFFLHYQKRVIDSSMWVREEVPAEIVTTKAQSDSIGFFSGNIGLVFLFAVVLLSGIAAWLGREESGANGDSVDPGFESILHIGDDGRIFDTKASIHDLFHRPSFHEPVVDGVRAIAVLWVLLFHAWFFQNPKWTNGHMIPLYESVFENPMFLWLVQGGLGVDMFFVISGFLIGAIILKEINRSDGMNMRRFYARRFLRLVPVYVVAMMAAIFFLDGSNAENAWANLLYVNNFLSIDDQFMGWCWSLAIEEQFYLVAPLFLLLMRKSESFLQWSVALMALGWMLRIFSLEYHDLPTLWDFRDLGSEAWIGRFDHTYDNFYTRYGGLLIGVIAAWIHVNRKAEVEEYFNSRKLAPLLISSCALLVFLFATFLEQRHLADSSYYVQLSWYAIEKDLFGGSLAVLIMCALHSKDSIAGALRGILSSRILYPIAQLSYSAYLMHEMVMIWLFPISSEFFIGGMGVAPNAVFVVNSIVSILLTLISAAILYVTIERPCMRFRKHPFMSRIDGTAKVIGDSKPKRRAPAGVIEAEVVTS